MTLGDLNALAVPAARDALAACCGSPRWVEQMLGARPFASRDAVHHASDDAWRKMAPADINAAIAHHPRIGEAVAAGAGGSRASDWSRGEQASISVGVAQLRQGNEEYERRFGHVFIVCASGLSADEILTRLRARMRNDPLTEMAATSEELRRITSLRLDKLFSET